MKSTVFHDFIFCKIKNTANNSILCLLIGLAVLYLQNHGARGKITLEAINRE